MILDLDHYTEQHLVEYLHLADIIVLSKLCKKLIKYKKHVIPKLNKVIKSKDYYNSAHNKIHLKYLNIYKCLYSIDSKIQKRLSNTVDYEYNFKNITFDYIPLIETKKLYWNVIKPFDSYLNRIQLHDYIEFSNYGFSVVADFDYLINEYFAKFETLLFNLSDDEKSNLNFTVYEIADTNDFQFAIRRKYLKQNTSFGSLSLNNIYLNILLELVKMEYYLENGKSFGYFENYRFSLTNYKYKDDNAKNVIMNYCKKFIPLCTRYVIFIRNHNDKISELQQFKNVEYIKTNVDVYLRK